MTLNPFKALSSFIKRHRERKLYSAYPQLSEYDRAIERAKRQKKKHSHIVKAKQEFITSALAGER